MSNTTSAVSKAIRLGKAHKKLASAYEYRASSQRLYDENYKLNVDYMLKISNKIYDIQAMILNLFIL